MEGWGGSYDEPDYYKNVCVDEEYSNDSAEAKEVGAIKFDGGKPCVWQGVINYFPRALWGVAEVSTFGAEKYAWAGWQNVENGYVRYQDAKYRHALKEAMGQKIDDDSELMHLKHEAWGALAVLELYLRDQETKDVPESSGPTCKG